jgi:transcription initiation factor TFIIIB Brf1 subunit/transcription initiation factor TFIIB
MKRLFAKKTMEPVPDWKKFFGVKSSSRQDAIEDEIQKQIKDNGIYTIFDKSNSKEEINKRLNERASKNWKIAEIILSGIAVFISIVTLLLNIY